MRDWKGYGHLNRIEMECRTCRYSIEDGGATLCTNEDRLWSESPEEVSSYQVCRLWATKEVS